MVAALFNDVLGMLAVAGVCAGMLFIANRIEPHWVSKDQRRFLTVAQELDHHGRPLGRKHEVRVTLEPDDDALLVRKRSLVRPGAGIWHVHGKSPKPPKGREIYMLSKDPSDGDVGQMAMRVPTRSKMIPRLDELLAARLTRVPDDPRRNVGHSGALRHSGVEGDEPKPDPTAP